MSFPTPFHCLLLIKWFAVDLHWLPVGGMTNAGSDESGWRYVLQVAAHLALPVLALVMLQAGSPDALCARQYARRGENGFYPCRPRQGVAGAHGDLKHALRNALPLSPCWASSCRAVLGAIITEKVFNWPGAGHIHIDSLAARDHPGTDGVYLFLAVLTMVGNLLADVLYLGRSAYSVRS